MADKSPLAEKAADGAAPEEVAAEIDFTKTSPIPDTFNRYDHMIKTTRNMA